MIFKDIGLNSFLKNNGLPTIDYHYSDKDRIFLSKNRNTTIVVPTPLNKSGHVLMIYSVPIESTGINDNIVVYGKNYNRNNKLFMNDRISETEIVGFFSCGGFVLVSSDEIENNKYYQFRRLELKPISFEKKSLFIKLERIGQHGKKIDIFKIRTMYPYAKYLDKGLIKEFGYNKNGKILNDFRITRFGKFLRKYYLDEVPQLINLIKGDIKLVGCRPVSSLFLKSYPNEVYNLRLQQKPGIISPAIADNARTVIEVIDSEYNYLLKVSKSPLKTKLAVFIKSIANFFIGKIKSQ